ncbi:MAG TPA: hypothetical protein VFZ53_06805 [Polyangiaceae bacterium]
MGKTRLFFPQVLVDRWVASGEAALSGSELTLRREGTRYRLVDAVRVLGEVTGTPDRFDVSGKVKTVGFVTELGAEVLGDSMVLGDNAFDTVIGWLGTPMPESRRSHAPGSDEELLARFLRKKL